MKKITTVVCLLTLILTGLEAEGQGLFGGRKRNRARSERTDKVRLETMPVQVKGEKFEMVLVRGGSYMMGCDPEFWSLSASAFAEGRRVYGMNKVTVRKNGLIGKNDEMPRHGVSVGSFYMGRYEVTQALWTAVMGYNPSNFVGEELPVEQVSYDEVQTFISRLRELTGLPFRLPTEAEWEYAARGGKEAKSTTFAGSDELMHVSWTQINSGDSTHIVGGLVPNELGLYDMTGNVWEWCSDWYAEDAYVRDVASNYNVPPTVQGRQQLSDYLVNIGEERSIVECILETASPNGPVSGVTKVGRGGSWADVEGDARVSYRNFWQPNTKLSVLGFRLVLSADSIPATGWMPNQYVMDSLAEGRAYSSMTTESMARLANGALEGLFSVSPTQRVRFSKGNLQYNAVADQWRFAENQYDVIGYDNFYYGEHYAGWIDLFAFGTSGYRNRPPYYFSLQNMNYGNGKRNIDRTSYDWGVYNAISNGGKRAGQWRTLSVNEWAYLLMRRPNAQLLMSPALINDHQGILLLPDDWLEKGGDTLQQGMIPVFSSAKWTEIEREGAVFLPCAGYAKLNNYYYGVPQTAEMEVVGINTGFADRAETAAPVSLMAEQANGGVDHTNPAEGVHYGDYGTSHIDGETPGGIRQKREWAKKFAYRQPYEWNEGLGYYWTTIQYDKRNAMGYCFRFGDLGFILPLERLTRLSVRLVQDE
ncbi:MAG: formylglycine-generating enzyme family protein [Bacteroidales bacterium]|nr:formylglycine-generating enzyme family protein [Bacteroidales bacterium]